MQRTCVSGSEGLGFESQRSHTVSNAKNLINKGFLAFFANNGSNAIYGKSTD